MKFSKGVKAVVLCLCAPKRFEVLARSHDNLLGRANLQMIRHTTRTIRTSVLSSLLLVVAAVAGGAVIGSLLALGSGPVSPMLVWGVEILGVAILLWATLGVKGWEIQTAGGETLGEKVNKWIYRSLYVMGTVILTVGVSWQLVGGTR